MYQECKSHAEPSERSSMCVIGVTGAQERENASEARDEEIWPQVFQT